MTKLEDNHLESTVQKSKMGVFCKLLYFVRSYITVFTVIFLLSAVSIVNSKPSFDLQVGSLVFAHLSDKGEGETVLKGAEETDTKKNTDIPLTKIASTNNFDFGIMSDNEDLAEEKIISDPISFSLFNGSSILAPSVYYDESLKDDKYGIATYEVVMGDTASSIATSFGISTYTVLWANHLKTGDIIKPGQKLEILPISGVKHNVEAGDTVEALATKYKADAEEIIIYNNLPADGIFPDGSVGKKVIIPSGEKESPITARVAPTPRTTNGQILSSSKYATSTFYNPLKSHRFAYGHCTYYVASKVYVPWNGHAKSWLVNARAYGYRTGNAPVVGSIVVTTESKLYGHVAYVEAVNETSITISEMNYVAWNRISVRILSKNSPVIRGYIYMD
ncbi:LysM peptidoglycan-binding domain-containing protein [Patescibacteria group bacterium]|nr:LysM peptidoglycan-binding domain-containing protein [Patescibacteria group bacterium]